MLLFKFMLLFWNVDSEEAVESPSEDNLGDVIEDCKEAAVAEEAVGSPSDDIGDVIEDPKEAAVAEEAVGSASDDIGDINEDRKVADTGTAVDSLSEDEIKFFDVM